ncbi:MAG: hypothetical protein HQL34_09695, partial [Alphaproteobacteria bacterium]|nr:hypothetical protein [Alphaproteobacteria bacterium]
MKKRLIVIGASDLIEIATASCPGHEIAGYADLEARSGGGVPYLGTDDDVLVDGGLADADFAVAIGDNGRRRRLVERLRRAGRQVVTVVHPS